MIACYSVTERGACHATEGTHGEAQVGREAEGRGKVGKSLSGGFCGKEWARQGKQS